MMTMMMMLRMVVSTGWVKENENPLLLGGGEKHIFDITYSNLLAPQATPKENVNIVLNYLIKGCHIQKRDRVPGGCTAGVGTNARSLAQLYIVRYISTLQNHTVLFCAIQYSNVLAPQATPKENPNIVLNYPYKSLLYSKKGPGTGRVHARCLPERQIPCAAIYS